MILTLGKGLLATRSLGEELLDLGDGLAAEADTLLRVEDGTLPDEGLDATGTTVDLVEGDLVDDLGTVLPASQHCQYGWMMAIGLWVSGRAQLTCGGP